MHSDLMHSDSTFGEEVRMARTVAIEKVTLYDLEQAFHLHFVEEPSFFPEWQND